MKLKPGVYAGQFTVANAGGASLDWTALPGTGVVLDLSAGTLAGGESVVVAFTIDKAQLAVGSFERSVEIEAEGIGSAVVQIKGSKPVNRLTWCATC